MKLLIRMCLMVIIVSVAFILFGCSECPKYFKLVNPTSCCAVDIHGNCTDWVIPSKTARDAVE